MEPTKVIVQKMKNTSSDQFSLAEKYYSILSAVNNLKLTQREIQLIAFTAIKGNISYANIRKEFCERYNSTSPTINNIISKLKKVNVLVKDGTKIKVNPVIILDFNKPITLQINLTHG
jgi:DNA-binding MarR family transcriptional regulator